MKNQKFSSIRQLIETAAQRATEQEILEQKRQKRQKVAESQVLVQMLTGVIGQDLYQFLVTGRKVKVDIEKESISTLKGKNDVTYPVLVIFEFRWSKSDEFADYYEWYVTIWSQFDSSDNSVEGWVNDPADLVNLLAEAGRKQSFIP
jgi:hypothetical protein